MLSSCLARTDRAIWVGISGDGVVLGIAEAGSIVFKQRSGMQDASCMLRNQLICDEFWITTIVGRSLTTPGFNS